jgi:HmuY protein
MSRASSLALLLTLSSSLSVGAACGGDDDGGDEDDDGSTEVDAGDDDGSGDDTGADASAECTPTDALPGNYRPIASVSKGTVTAEPGKGVTQAVIDATAGEDASADNPYIYLDLVEGAKVEIDDVAALESDAWDVAFKRSSLRTNGGDSGTGGVEVAQIEGATIDEVTDPPADDQFTSDDWVSDDCQFQSDTGLEPASAFGVWYEYDKEAGHLVTPLPNVYVLRAHDGELYKFAIESYYGEDDTAAVYSVLWAPL